MTNTFDLSKNEEFIKDVIKKADPTIDLSRTTPLYDLTVNLYNKSVTPAILIKEQQIINNRSLLITNQPDESYDELLANNYTYRDNGNPTKIMVKVFFSKPEQIEINTDSLWKSQGVNFIPDFAQTFLVDDFIQTDVDEYSINVKLTSEDIGIETIIGTDSSIETSLNVYPNFLRAYVYSIILEGKNKQSNNEAYEKAKKEFTQRDLSSARSVIGVFSEKYSNIVSQIYSAGYQEKEMFRDREFIDIPKRVARIYFNEKFSLFIPKGTIFNFNFDPEIIYSNKNEINIDENSNLWKLTPRGSIYIETEMEMDSPFNPSGFIEDMPLQCNYIDIEYPNYFLGAHAKTAFDSTGRLKYGGKSDIYIKTPVFRENITIKVPVDTGGFITFPESLQPVLKVHSVKRINSQNLFEDVNLFDLSVNDPVKRFTADDDVKLFVDPTLAGQNVNIEFSYAPDIKDINEFANNEYNRSLHGETMIRFRCPIFVGVFFNVLGPNRISDEIKTSVTSYINNISGGALDKSTLISKIQNDIALVKSIDLNSIIIIAQQYLPDGSIIELEDNNIILPVTDYEIGVSMNTCTFITEAVGVNI